MLEPIKGEELEPIKGEELLNMAVKCYILSDVYKRFNMVQEKVLWLHIFYQLFLKIKDESESLITRFYEELKSVTGEDHDEKSIEVSRSSLEPLQDAADLNDDNDLYEIRDKIEEEVRQLIEKQKIGKDFKKISEYTNMTHITDIVKSHGPIEMLREVLILLNAFGNKRRIQYNYNPSVPHFQCAINLASCQMELKFLVSILKNEEGKFYVIFEHEDQRLGTYADFQKYFFVAYGVICNKENVDEAIRRVFPSTDLDRLKQLLLNIDPNSNHPPGYIPHALQSLEKLHSLASSSVNHDMMISHDAHTKVLSQIGCNVDHSFFSNFRSFSNFDFNRRAIDVISEFLKSSQFYNDWERHGSFCLDFFVKSFSTLKQIKQYSKKSSTENMENMVSLSDIPDIISEEKICRELSNSIKSCMDVFKVQVAMEDLNIPATDKKISKSDTYIKMMGLFDEYENEQELRKTEISNHQEVPPGQDSNIELFVDKRNELLECSLSTLKSNQLQFESIIRSLELISQGQKIIPGITSSLIEHVKNYFDVLMNNLSKVKQPLDDLSKVEKIVEKMIEPEDKIISDQRIADMSRDTRGNSNPTGFFSPQPNTRALSMGVESLGTDEKCPNDYAGNKPYSVDCM